MAQVEEVQLQVAGDALPCEKGAPADQIQLTQLRIEAADEGCDSPDAKQFAEVQSP